MIKLLFSVLAASLLLSATEVKPINSAPAGTDLGKFPILKQGGLTVEKSLDLRLIPARLDESVVVYNHYRIDNSWKLQTLQKGDLVYKDQETGEIRYRAYCSNRVVVVKNCPTPPPIPTQKKEIGWLDNMVDRFTNGWRASTGAVGTAWGVLLPMLGFLAFPLVGIGWWLYRGLRPVPPQTPQAPAPVVPPPTTPVAQAPPPSSVTTTFGKGTRSGGGVSP